MNTKLSGAQLVLVEIKRVGRNYLPFVENIRSRVIKYIDYAQCDYLPDTTDRAVTGTTDMSFTIYNEFGTDEIQRNVPLERFDYAKTLGVRQPICAKIALQKCFIDCQDAAQVGKIVPLVFWYDLPEYSARNSTEKVITDAISVPLTTATRYNVLPDADRLVGKRFRKVLLGFPSVTPDFQTGLATGFENLYLTLRKGTYNVCENLPLGLLYQLGMLQESEFANIIFDTQNSFITIGGANTIPNVQTNYIGKAVFFNVQYEQK